MNYTLFDLFLNAYNGNSFAQLQIVQRFQPLLKKYAALLKYEDAYSDLQLYLLELLHSGKLTKLQRKDDGTLVKYIESSIRHAAGAKRSPEPSGRWLHHQGIPGQAGAQHHFPHPEKHQNRILLPHHLHDLCTKRRIEEVAESAGDRREKRPDTLP